MNITGTVGRLNLYKVCWADCYGEEHTDYVAVPYGHREEAAKSVIKETNGENFMHLTAMTRQVQIDDLYIVLP